VALFCLPPPTIQYGLQQKQKPGFTIHKFLKQLKDKPIVDM
jgi:hypothetical protein